MHNVYTHVYTLVWLTKVQFLSSHSAERTPHNLETECLSPKGVTYVMHYSIFYNPSLEQLTCTLFI